LAGSLLPLIPLPPQVLVALERGDEPLPAFELTFRYPTPAVWKLAVCLLMGRMRARSQSSLEGVWSCLRIKFIFPKKYSMWPGIAVSLGVPEPADEAAESATSSDSLHGFVSSYSSWICLDSISSFGSSARGSCLLLVDPVEQQHLQPPCKHRVSPLARPTEEKTNAQRYCPAGETFPSAAVMRAPAVTRLSCWPARRVC
jgi:hypothetical protein